MDSTQENLNSRIRLNVSNLSDEDLTKMLASTKDYTAVAVAAAQEELAKRGGKEAIRHRIAQRVAQEAPVQIELPERTRGILMVLPKADSGWDIGMIEGEAVLKAHSGWDYIFVEDETVVASIKVDSSFWKEAGEISIEESIYPVYRVLNGEYAGDLVLECQGLTLARAQDAVFSSSFKIEYGGKKYTLEAATVSGNIFDLLHKNRLVGTLTSEQYLTESTRVELPADIPLPVVAFTFWLVLLAWKKGTA